jgi:plasmid stabilization system protein ParE
VELFDAVEQLIDFPESGRVVPEVGAREVRELIFGAYRVFYRVGSSVEVLSVRHGSQLLRADEVHED